MVLTRGGHRYRPRVQTSTPARDGAGTSKAAVGHSLAQDTEAPTALAHDAAVMQSPASAAISEEAQGSEPPSRRYHTRVGPRPPFSSASATTLEGPASKRALTSGPGESSRPRPKPIQTTTA